MPSWRENAGEKNSWSFWLIIEQPLITQQASHPLSIYSNVNISKLPSNSGPKQNPMEELAQSRDKAFKERLAIKSKSKTTNSDKRFGDQVLVKLTRTSKAQSRFDPSPFCDLNQRDNGERRKREPLSGIMHFSGPTEIHNFFNRFLLNRVRWSQIS